MDPDEVIRALVSVGLVVTMSLGANCQGAAGSVLQTGADNPLEVMTQAGTLQPHTVAAPDATKD